MPESLPLPTSSGLKRHLLPLALVLIAVLIRLPGITWGLKDNYHNQSLHPDEELNFRHSREIEPAHLSFVPGPSSYQFYSYGTLYLTTMRIADDVIFGYGGGSDHPNDDWDYIRRGELGGRIISLIAGSLLCLVAFFTVRRFATDLGATAASLTLAFAPALVVHSRFATVDVFAALFIALSGLYAVKLLMDDDGKWVKWAILAGVCAGLSAGTKYTGILALLMPLLAIGLRRPPKAIILGGVSILSAVVAFIVSTPGSVLDTDRFIHDVKYETVHASSGHGMVFTGTSSGYVYHLANLSLGVGTILTFLGLGALIWAAIQKKRWVWLLLVFAVPYYLTIGGAEVKFIRYVFPVTIAIAAGVGYAVSEGHRLGKGYRILAVLGILGIGGIEGGGLRGSTAFTFAMASGLDNRERAGLDMKTMSNPIKGDARFFLNGKTDTTVGLISDPWFWSPTLYPDVAMARFVSPAVREARMRKATHPIVVRFEQADAAPLQYDPRLVTETRPDYIVFSDFETLYVDRISRMKVVPDDFIVDVERYKAFATALEANYKLMEQYGDAGDMVEDMRYVMPTVYVWVRKN